jgi:hypothetical protein
VQIDRDECITDNLIVIDETYKCRQILKISAQYVQIWNEDIQEPKNTSKLDNYSELGFERELPGSFEVFGVLISLS